MSHPRFIVVFKKTATKDEIDRSKADIASNGGKVTHEYGTALNGFAAEIPEAFLNKFQSSFTSAIDYIEPDQVVTTQ